MSEQNRQDERQAFVAPEQKDESIQDLPQRDAAKDESDQTKGGGMNYELQDLDWGSGS